MTVAPDLMVFHRRISFYTICGRGVVKVSLGLFLILLRLIISSAFYGIESRHRIKQAFCRTARIRQSVFTIYGAPFNNAISASITSNRCFIGFHRRSPLSRYGVLFSRFLLLLPKARSALLFRTNKAFSRRRYRQAKSRNGGRVAAIDLYPLRCRLQPLQQ